MGSIQYAQVIIDLNHAQLDRIFEYSIPEELQEQIVIGQRVAVPFGHRRQMIEGFVVEISNIAVFDPLKIKPIQKVLDSYPVFLPDQIELARWMAGKYCCNLVSTLRLMIPAQLRGGRVREKNQSMVELLLKNDELEEALQSLQSQSGMCKAPKQRDILQYLEIHQKIPMNQLGKYVLNAHSAVRSMEKKGWLQLIYEEQYRQPYQSISLDLQVEPKLTEDQRQAVDTICSGIQYGGGRYILHGVTGSGKTEVYLQCIHFCLNQERSAIVLVPEISLTPQTVERFRARFGEKIAVLHSRLSSGERYDEWRRIRLGEVSVVVGARSAVFAPLEHIGLIVIDEEHESSYQSESVPRYHAIEVAEKRCEQQEGSLLLGSATPSIETWYRAKKGELDIVTLPKRINRQPLPKVEVVDMREELARGNKNMFSTQLYQQMKICYLEQKQAIIFLNRRGYSTFVSCRACGEVLTCKQCDVSMTYHKVDDTVRCHYCDAIERIPDVCPACGKSALKHFGVGTEQVEEQIQRLLPGIRTIRMDYDTTQRKNAHIELLQAFREHQADVLVGTQMIAKGLDFPNVTLVGVLAADATLFIPDYRSAERAFQLITQVAGRAGRDQDPGSVVVQTYSPSHPSITFSAKHDFESFYEYEIVCRKQSEFPPFADFVRFLFSGENDEQVAEQCHQFKDEILADLEGFMVSNKMDRDTLLYVSAHASPLHVLRKQYRYQVVLKMVRNKESTILMKRIAVFSRENKRGYVPHMEINPQSML